MSKIHPTERKCSGGRERPPGESTTPAVWTVWKKSSMTFQGTDGFSVYDGNGKLGFRVDNYSRRSKYFVGDIVLMDGQGKPLLTLKPQIFTMHDRWNGFDSKRANSTSHLFTDFRCDGCFAKRCCKIWSSKGEVAAVIMQKKVNSVILGNDVFSLIVNPGFDSELIMAFVVVMDRMCHKSYTSFLCS